MSDQAGVVIKDDLKFVAQCVQIVSQNKIEIDCEFEGDVTGPEVSGFVAEAVHQRIRSASDCPLSCAWGPLSFPQENLRPAQKIRP